MTAEEKLVKPDAATGDVGAVEELYQVMCDEGLDLLELKDGDSHIRLVRRGHPRAAAGAPVSHLAPHALPAAPPRTSSAPVASAAAPENTITSPLAGVFYRASSPTSASFVKEGDVVDVGQTLCIVEAMKVMNEIKAETRCKIMKIVAENSRPITPGQTLFVIQPA